MSPERLIIASEIEKKKSKRRRRKYTKEEIEARVQKRAEETRKERNNMIGEERDLRAKASGGQLFETPIEIMRDLGQ